MKASRREFLLGAAAGLLLMVFDVSKLAPAGLVLKLDGLSGINAMSFYVLNLLRTM